MAIMNWIVYMPVFQRVCPGAMRFANQSWSQKVRDKPGQIDLAKQVLLDNAIYGPVMIFPCFYLLKAAVQERISFVEGLSRYRDNILEDNLLSCSFWVPADIIIFAAPSWLRMPLVSGGSYTWMVILSWARGKPAEASGGGVAD